MPDYAKVEPRKSTGPHPWFVTEPGLAVPIAVKPVPPLSSPSQAVSSSIRCCTQAVHRRLFGVRCGAGVKAPCSLIDVLCVTVCGHPQGQLGDCWLLGAMAAVANHSGKVRGCGSRGSRGPTRI